MGTVPEIPKMGGGYKTILCDPPWTYAQELGRADQGDATRGGLPYESMTLEEMRALPVGSLAAPDCQLWLWTTNTHIHEAFHLIEAWGFRYITKAVWVKNRIGLGYWLRGQTEDLLLAVRGNPRAKFTGPNGATGKAWSTVIDAPTSKHSRKPGVVYTMIEDMGESPRLEMFARLGREGWTSWGAEAGRVTQQLIVGPDEPH